MAVRSISEEIKTGIFTVREVSVDTAQRLQRMGTSNAIVYVEVNKPYFVYVSEDRRGRITTIRITRWRKQKVRLVGTLFFNYPRLVFGDLGTNKRCDKALEENDVAVYKDDAGRTSISTFARIGKLNGELTLTSKDRILVDLVIFIL